MATHAYIEECEKELHKFEATTLTAIEEGLALDLKLDDGNTGPGTNIDKNRDCYGPLAANLEAMALRALQTVRNIEKAIGIDVAAVRETAAVRRY